MYICILTYLTNQHGNKNT